MSKNCGVPPTLSILIPAYNQPEGVERILCGLLSIRGRPDIEILVSDDSSNDSAALRIRAACERFGNIHYVLNRPILGAVQNWNELLRLGRGEYLWLLHHDEEPESCMSLPALVQALASPNAAEICILECRVVNSPGARPVLHFPARWAMAIIRRWPGYLLRRNLIGSPSCLIVKRQRCIAYDERLQWRVDVEGYVRMLQPPFQVMNWPSGGVISYRDRENSITARLASNLNVIDARELELLRASHGQRSDAIPWLRRDTWASLCRLLETVGWTSFRLAYRLFQRIYISLT